MAETFPLEQAAIAFDKMMAAKVRFRAVLKIACPSQSNRRHNLGAVTPD
jgi:hypothetical protein